MIDSTASREYDSRTNKMPRYWPFMAFVALLQSFV
jgi:hypothetical protein